LPVLLQKPGVRFEDADNLDIVPALRGSDETVDVSVDQSGDREPHFRWFLRPCETKGQERDRQRASQDFHKQAV
jgi:hypothetical protein